MTRVFLDCETDGLDARANRLILVGFAVDDGDPVALRHPEDADLIQAFLDLDGDFIGHNACFDLAFLECAGYRIPDPSLWIDTVLEAHVAGERKPGQTALRRLTKKLVELGRLPHKILEPEDAIKAWLRTSRRQAFKEGHRRPELGDAPAHLLKPYLGADIAATRAVHAHYAAAVNGQASVLELERRLMPAIFTAERRGVPVDVEAAAELRDRTETTVGDWRARLFELAGRAFNPNAARQIERALIERGADLSDIPRTPRAGQPMFTADTLATVDDELARTLLDYRAEKKLHDYVVNLWRHVHDARLYGSFHQLGTETGRMSSGEPNLQNVPRGDLRVRYTIAAAEGKALVGCDLDTVELRILAAYAPGGALERAFADGVDLHQQTADALGISRDNAKTMNYATIYGAGAQLISTRLRCSVAEARDVLERWFVRYPEVRRLRSKLWKSVERRGYLETIGGRRHYFERPNHMLLNRLVSGSAADLFKLAIVRLHQQQTPMILFVHDEVVAEVDEHDADRVARLLEIELERGLSRRGVNVDHLVAKATIAQRWSDFKQPGYIP
jgi:DNA polymerase-1